MHSTSICGTPEYMPPEVIREEGHGVGMDYWGLGVLTYEMMCGCTPFSSDDAKGLFVNILMHDPAFVYAAEMQHRRSRSTSALSLVTSINFTAGMQTAKGERVPRDEM